MNIFLADKKRKLKNNNLCGLKSLCLLIFVLLVCAVPHSLNAAEYNIPPGDVAALIDAINAANSSPGPDTINLAPHSIYSLMDYYYDEADQESGLPSLSGEIVINGNNSTIENATNDTDNVKSFRIFFIRTTANIIMKDLTIAKGIHLAVGPAGGGISNNGGSVEMINCVVTQSRDDDHGGGIYNAGTMKLKDCGITQNTAKLLTYGFGGGIYNSGTLVIENSTINDNLTGGFGRGSGIYNSGTLVVMNSTLSGNVMDELNLLDFRAQGGAIYNTGGTVTLSNCTVTDNRVSLDSLDRVGQGGGIYNESGSLTLANTVVANQVRGEDCYGPVTSIGYNLDSDGTCNFASTGDLSNDSGVNLGPLQDNGGPTPTHALLLGSSAIDAGNPNGCTDPDGNLLTTDQRGFTRPFNGRCDIGAFEFTLFYKASGLFNSIDPIRVNLKKAKAYPAKWKLTEGDGTPITSPAAIDSMTFKPTDCNAFTNDPAGATDALAAGRASLRFDIVKNQYVFNWATPGSGCYTLFLTLDSGQVFPAYFTIR